MIHINGPEQMVNLAHMLIAFGEYAGIGIKSSLGMGDVEKGEKRQMTDERIKLIIGSLLHDVGKIIYRTSDRRTHAESGYHF